MLYLKFELIDKLLIVYLYICFVLWLFLKMFEYDIKNKVIKSKPFKSINTSVKIWFHIIKKRKLISDDNIQKSIKLHQINCSKIKFVKEVIIWCINNIDTNKNRIIRLNLKYYKHKNLMGSYNYQNKTITIYFNSHNNVESLVDTIIHEHDHAKAILSRKHQIEYDRFTKDISYYNNPYEIRARKAGYDYRLKCIFYLYKMNYLK